MHLIISFTKKYENQQISVNKSWSKPWFRPKYSDITGKIDLSNDNIALPKGWDWVSNEWSIVQDTHTQFDNDTGFASFKEEIYEQNYRLIPGSNWTKCEEAKRPFLWCDMYGENVSSKETFEISEDWNWNGDWEIDLNRLVDHEGWEYSIDGSSLSDWTPHEKIYHLLRRRKWTRNRKRINNTTNNKDNSLNKSMMNNDEGWLYAKTFNSRFHIKYKNTHAVRRRLWIKEMKPSSSCDSLDCYFSVAEVYLILS